MNAEIHENGFECPADMGSPHGCTAGIFLRDRKEWNTDLYTSVLKDTEFVILFLEKAMGKRMKEYDWGRKGCGFMLCYPVIDAQKTGSHLKKECERLHITVKELQQFLGLAAMQSVYNWFQGRTLPSLDNFYALSCYMGMRMEEMVVTKRCSQEVLVRNAANALQSRALIYLGYLLSWCEAECAHGPQ